MICSVSANPCLDVTLTLPEMQRGIINRLASSRTDVSGKGVNVACALQALGAQTLCIGYNFLANGQMLEDKLHAQGVPYRFINCPGAIRTNRKIIETNSHTMTELNESGSPVTEEQKQQLLALVRETAAKAACICFSGSLPPGAGNHFYAQLLAAAKGTLTALDASGPSLREGLQGEPSLLKPNLHELNELLGGKAATPADALACAKQLLTRKTTLVCVSLGAEGAIITNGKKSFFAPALPVPVCSTVGAGDALLAGILQGLEEKQPLREAFARGLAAAAANVQTEGTAGFTLQAYREQLPAARNCIQALQ